MTESEPPSSVPCATPHLEPAEVWRAVLEAASEKASIHTLISNLTLVSINPDRAVIGHAQRDRLTAEMALGHLAQLFERTLGRRIAVSIMQIKDAPRPAAPVPAPSELRLSGSGPTPPPAQRASAAPTRPEPTTAPPRTAPVPPPAPRPMAPVDVEAAKANPLVQRAAELLNAKVVRITARNDPPQQQT